MPDGIVKRLQCLRFFVHAAAHYFPDVPGHGAQHEHNSQKTPPGDLLFLLQQAFFRTEQGILLFTFLHPESCLQLCELTVAFGIQPLFLKRLILFEMKDGAVQPAGTFEQIGKVGVDVFLRQLHFQRLRQVERLPEIGFRLFPPGHILIRDTILTKPVEFISGRCRCIQILPARLQGKQHLVKRALLVVIFAQIEKSRRQF